MCLHSDALSQHLPSHLGFSYFGRGVSLNGCSSKAQPLLLTLDEGYLLMATPPDIECGVAPLSCHAQAEPKLLGCGLLLSAAAPDLRNWVRGGEIRLIIRLTIFFAAKYGKAHTFSKNKTWS